jgi:hypothetical protein
MSHFPPPVPPTDFPPFGSLRPHRGGVVLALGILSLVLNCFILGIIAWVMANSDLREMRAGMMDPGGYSVTKAGQICGIISVCLALAALLLWLLFVCGGMACAATGIAVAG